MIPDGLLGQLKSIVVSLSGLYMLRHVEATSKTVKVGITEGTSVPVAQVSFGPEVIGKVCHQRVPLVHGEQTSNDIWTRDSEPQDIVQLL